MKDRVFETNFSVLQGVFEQFNEAVKRYPTSWEKLEYSSWKKLKSFLYIHKNEHALVVYKGKEVHISAKEITSCSHAAKPDKFCVIGAQEKGFTTFLLTQLKEMYEVPTYTTNTITTANDIYCTSNTTAIPNYGNIYTTTTSPSYTYTKRSNEDCIDVGGVVIDKNGITINGKKVLTEEDPMTTKDFGLNFDFGPVTDNTLAVCPFGIAAKNPEGGYCYYDPKEKKIMDCTPFTFDTKKFLFKMPVAIAAVTVGDVIMHRGFPMFVKGVEDEDGRIMVIDIAEAEEKYILPTRNMFGFDFVTKVVSFMDMKNTGACVDNPFGNMLPLLMLMKDDKDLDPMMLLMMNGGQIGGMNMDAFTKNPLMMYMMMKDSKNLKDMLPFLMMTSTMPVQR